MSVNGFQRRARQGRAFTADDPLLRVGLSGFLLAHHSNLRAFTAFVLCLEAVTVNAQRPALPAYGGATERGYARFQSW